MSLNASVPREGVAPTRLSASGFEPELSANSKHRGI